MSNVGHKVGPHCTVCGEDLSDRDPAGHYWDEHGTDTITDNVGERAYRLDMHAQRVIDAAILSLHRLMVDDLAQERIGHDAADQAVGLLDILRRESAAITKTWD